MKRHMLSLFLLALIAGLVSGCDLGSAPTSTLPTTSPTPTTTSTLQPMATPTATALPPTLAAALPTSTQAPPTPTVPPTFTPTPVPPTSTPTPTETAPPPTSTHTLRPTNTPTATPSSTPTHTPTATHSFTPANTPEPTATPTNTPTPEPICEVLAGALNMRYGPGVVYAPPIQVLEQGTKLRPLARNAAGTWIQVQAGDTVGWVSVDADLIGCNVPASDLPEGEVPPTPTATHTPTEEPTPEIPVGLEAAPKLRNPPHRTEIEGPWVELFWSWHRNLKPDEYFDVRFYFGGQAAWGIAWTKDFKFAVDSNRPVWQHGPGWYRWRIAVIEGKEGQVTREVSQASEEWVVIWGGTGGLRINYGASRAGYTVKVRKSGVDRSYTVRSDGWIDTGLTLPPGQYTVDLYAPSGTQGCPVSLVLYVNANKYTVVGDPPC